MRRRGSPLPCSGDLPCWAGLPRADQEKTIRILRRPVDDAGRPSHRRRVDPGIP